MRLKNAAQSKSWRVWFCVSKTQSCGKSQKIDYHRSNIGSGCILQEHVRRGKYAYMVLLVKFVLTVRQKIWNNPFLCSYPLSNKTVCCWKVSTCVVIVTTCQDHIYISSAASNDDDCFYHLTTYFLAFGTVSFSEAFRESAVCTHTLYALTLFIFRLSFSLSTAAGTWKRQKRPISMKQVKRNLYNLPKETCRYVCKICPKWPVDMFQRCVFFAISSKSSHSQRKWRQLLAASSRATCPLNSTYSYGH